MQMREKTRGLELVRGEAEVSKDTTTCAPQQEYTEEQHHTATSQESPRPNPEECCVHFSFTLPSSKPSRRSEETRVHCRERVVMVKTITSLCEDLNTEWVEKVINAYGWCLKKGYAPKQDSSEIQPLYFNQFLVAKTREDCCYLFSQTPGEVFTTQEEKISNVCEQISFNVTVRTTTSDCTRNHVSLSREFIRTTYNCLRWAFSDD
ncbi:hypothetical protein PDJAM_G00196310 [Pangasius djambal]|uniref:Uncharacterized protein n=1 Tax=Pangasius djambal TaxID=1691987 RepID=A0ACC5Y6B9_9TELE|nr:hypothetical protein [Pangasius djambal]